MWSKKDKLWKMSYENLTGKKMKTCLKSNWAQQRYCTYGGLETCQCLLFQVQHVDSCYTLQHNYLNINSENLVEHHSSIPKFVIFLSSLQIIFKDVQFLEKQTAMLEIVNTGQVSIFTF